MLHLLRKNRKSLVIAFLVGLLCLVMLPFGSGTGGSGNGRESHDVAIRVNDKKITVGEYHQKLEQVQRLLRQQLGASYLQFASMMNLEQQTIDDFINSSLLEELTAKLGLAASVQQMEAELLKQPYFGGNVTAEAYQDFLRAQGLTGAQLEEQMSRQIVSEQVRDLTADLSTPTDFELRQIAIDDNRKASFKYLAFAPADFAGKVAMNKQEEIERYYGEHAESYRRPRAVSFTAVPFPPDQFLPQVEISEQDLRDAYEERAHTFTEPAQAKLRRIVIYKQRANTEFDKMMGLNQGKPEENAKAKAEKALAELTGDKKFSNVAAEYSEEPEAAKNGGDWGWKLYQDLDSKIRPIASKLAEGEYSKVIELPDSFQIVYLEQERPKRQKTFEEVRAEVEQELRRADAPEYAKAAADALLQQFEQQPEDSRADLKTFAESRQKIALVTPEPLSSGASAPDIPAALSTKTAAMQDGDRDVITLGDVTYIVQVTGVRDAYVPPLGEVRQKVEEDYRRSQSQKLAHEAAEKALAELQGSVPEKDKASPEPPNKKTMEQVAAEYGLSVQTTEPGTRTTAKGPLFATPDGRRLAFTLNENNKVLNQVIEAGGTEYVVELASSTPPDEKELEKGMAELRLREARRGGNRLLEVLLRRLRAGADIYVNPELLNKEARPISPPVDIPVDDF